MASGFYSKPVYRLLQPVASRSYHLIICDSQGIQRARKLKETIKTDSMLIVVSENNPQEIAGDEELLQHGDLPNHLRIVLGKLPVTTQFYLLGREQFIWRAQEYLRELGVPDAICSTERCGTVERDVYCVHCRHITPSVTRSPVECGQCQKLLHVYDHFSKRLCAYMGFKVNAECEEEIPPTRELVS